MAAPQKTWLLAVEGRRQDVVLHLFGSMYAEHFKACLQRIGIERHQAQACRLPRVANDTIVLVKPIETLRQLI